MKDTKQLRRFSTEALEKMDASMNSPRYPVTRILDYIGETTGYAIEVKPNVPLDAEIDACKDLFAGKSGAIAVLNEAFKKKSCTVIECGQKLIVMTLTDAKKSYIPIKVFLPQLERMNDSPAPASSVSSN